MTIPRGEHSWLTKSHIELLTADSPHFIDLEALVETKVVNRTWRDRLFTRPWHPLRTYHVVTSPLRMIGACRIGETTFYVGHPEYIKYIKMRRLELEEE